MDSGTPPLDLMKKMVVYTPEWTKVPVVGPYEENGGLHPRMDSGIPPLDLTKKMVGLHPRVVCTPEWSTPQNGLHPRLDSEWRKGTVALGSKESSGP